MSTNDHCMIAYNNLASSLYAALAGGAWTSSLPLANVLDRIIGRVARSSDATLASTQFSLSLDRARPVAAVALVNHNLSTTARVRVRANVAADFSGITVYDSGWRDAWPRTLTPRMLYWVDTNFWSGRMLTESKDAYRWLYLDQMGGRTVSARYWKVEIDDAANPDGYVQVGRLFLGRSLIPVRNMSYGASIGFETRTSIEETPGGTEYFDIRPSRRVARFSLDWLDESEAAMVMDMQQISGAHGEVIFMWRRSDHAHLLRRSFMGRVRTLNEIEQPYANSYSTAFEIQEIL